MTRRSFLAASAVVSAAPSILASSNEPLRVAVIGHTGRGNFGHGLDTVWLRVPETKIVAVADPSETGLKKELRKLRVDRGFADYRKMLAVTKPDLIAVCPRHADQHRDMALAGIKAGAKGVYLEKPFCRTPAEADDLVAACDKHGAKIAVAHRNRWHPALQVIDQLIADGGIGRLLEIRGRGKGDRRGGDEDLWVLGSHVLNLMAYFGGEAKSCSAVMLHDGRRVRRADVKDGKEGLGPLAANELHARYEMAKGAIGTFDSIANDGTKNAGFGLQLIGSEGIVNLQCDRDPVAYLVPGNPFQPTGKPRPWIPITTSGVGNPEGNADLVGQIHNHVAPVRDLIKAVQDDREPLCGARDGAATVEMIFGVFESHRQGGRAVALPLKERDHPLAKL